MSNIAASLRHVGLFGIIRALFSHASDIGRRFNATAFLRHVRLSMLLDLTHVRFPTLSSSLLRATPSFVFVPFEVFLVALIYPLHLVRLSVHVTPHQLLLSRIYKVTGSQLQMQFSFFLVEGLYRIKYNSSISFLTIFPYLFCFLFGVVSPSLWNFNFL